MTFIDDLHLYTREARSLIRSDGGPYEHDPKKYPRFPTISLAQPAPLLTSLSEALATRKSAAHFSNKPIRLEDLSQLLGHGAKIHDGGHRPYPSGGGLYPLEIYLLAFNVTTLQRAVFHYRPDTHVLEHLWDIPEGVTAESVAGSAGQQAAGVLLFTAVWSRSSQKYGDFAYYLIHLEAGHLCQNLTLLSAALGLGIRPMAGFNDGAIADILDLDPKKEQPIYSALLGNTAGAQKLL